MRLTGFPNKLSQNYMPISSKLPHPLHLPLCNPWTFDPRSSVAGGEFEPFLTGDGEFEPQVSILSSGVQVLYL